MNNNLTRNFFGGINLYLYIVSEDEKLVKASTETIKLLFPEFGIIKDELEIVEQKILLDIKINQTNQEIKMEMSLHIESLNNIPKSIISFREEIQNHAEVHNQLKRMAKLGAYQILTQYLKKPSAPWGILTGIRPTKIVHRLIDQGCSKEEINKHLIDFYNLREDKAILLTDVAFRQRKYLLDEIEARKLVSIYIGIPFCPTRCAYCSFPAYSIKQWGKLVDPYLKALHLEIRKASELLQKFNLEVETIYIGGGTPTSLSPKQLGDIVQLLNEKVISNKTKEFTVEAGRPDTITEEMLMVLKEGGVNRLSINPQSMQEKTLVAIGRNHTPMDVIEKVKLAREIGFNNINMDIIIGLPDEESEDVKLTMEAIKEINPENLTVHTMAIKRASRLKENREDYKLPLDIEVSKMFEITRNATDKMNMHPYYLYRQKQILGQLENIGFAKEGFDCLYNIQMMEERQTIIGLGVGSGSKFVQPEIWTLESMYNPKDPSNYIERIDELISRKEEMLSNIQKK